MSFTPRLLISAAFAEQRQFYSRLSTRDANSAPRRLGQIDAASLLITHAARERASMIKFC